MTYIPSIIYEVDIRDHSGNLIVYLDTWERLEFTQRLNDPWNHTIYVRLSPDNALGPLLRSLKRDYFFTITRTDMYTAERTIVYEGFHNTSSEQMQANGDIFFSLYGSGYTVLLDRRLVLPINMVNYQSTYIDNKGLSYNGEGAAKAGTDNDKAGIAETVIKEYVYDCFLDPLYPDRYIQGFHLAADLLRGINVEYSARYVNLESVIKALMETAKMDYGITRYSDYGTFLFDCRPNWGTDRRVDNTEGNPPIVFSCEHGNMFIPIYSTNHRHEKNYLYIGGDGEGENRKIIMASDPVAIAESPWGRSELFVSENDVNSEKELRDKGMIALKERGKETNFDFDFIQTRATRWPLHWGLGDIVTAYYQGLRFDKKIDGITINVSLNTDKIETLSIALIDAPAESTSSSLRFSAGTKTVTSNNSDRVSSNYHA